MIGYTYQSFYIITIEINDGEYKTYCYESYSSKLLIKNWKNAIYITGKYKIIEIEDLHHNKFDNIDKLSKSKINIFDKTGVYSINNVYEEKIHFWLNKEIAFNNKIRDSRDYKKLAKHKNPSNGVYALHNISVPEYKKYLEKYFYDIDGISGIYKQYYPNGVLEKECYHNNDKYEGEHKRYNDKGDLQEITTYINGLRHGKNIEYYENGYFIHRNYIDDNKYEVIEFIQK